MDPYRLGSNGFGEVRSHHFFKDFAWDLLEQQLLPAPFVPDPRLVYAKDEIPTLASDETPGYSSLVTLWPATPATAPTASF